MVSMSNLTAIKFDSAYRQLTAVDRAFVDDFVSRVETIAERSGRDVQDVLETWPEDMLSPRDTGHLGSPLVRAAVSERVADLRAAMRLSRKRLLKELVAMALYNVGDYLDEYGNVDITRCTPEQRSAIKEYKFDMSDRRGVRAEIKGFDKQKAIEMILRLQGAFGDASVDASDFSIDRLHIDSMDQSKMAEMYSRKLENFDND